MARWEIALNFADYASSNGYFWNSAKNVALVLHRFVPYSISSRELITLVVSRLMTHRVLQKVSPG